MEYRKYRLGDYEFDTYEEYVAAEDDLKKIDLITKEVDIQDIDVAIGLYTRIRNKEIVFRSKVGVNFFTYLSDIVANHSMAMVKEQKERESKKKKNLKKSKIYKWAGAMCVLAAVASFGIFSYHAYREEQSDAAMKRLQDMQNMTGAYIKEEVAMEQNDMNQTEEAEIPATSDDSNKQNEEVVEEALTILPQYQAIYEENPDLIGWLQIPDTDVNYPVLQTEKENGEYYLERGFYGEKDKNGSLFLDVRNKVEPRDTNLIIYGHNMKNGDMFGGLKEYLNKDYWKAHKTVLFDTIYEKATYEIVGVFLSEVSQQNEYAFRYYNFLNARSEQEFDAFMVNVEQLQAFDGETLDIAYEDELLMLSTCNNYTEDGRMFLLAKKVSQ